MRGSSTRHILGQHGLCRCVLQQLLRLASALDKLALQFKPMCMLLTTRIANNTQVAKAARSVLQH